MDATTGLWDTWEDDALVLDRARGHFADPNKVHELDFDGKWFSVRGPLTVPRSPQGRPVLLQAGSSGRGRDFAARWAELIFSGDPGIEIARSHYKDQKERVGKLKTMETGKIAPLAVYLVSEAAKDVSGQIFGVRANEIFLFSQNRPVRSVHRDGGWTPETVASHAVPALRADFYPLERSQDVFSWDPA